MKNESSEMVWDSVINKIPGRPQVRSVLSARGREELRYDYYSLI